MEFLAHSFSADCQYRPRREVCLAREFEAGLKSAYHEFSVIVLASRSGRGELTHEQLADRLRNRATRSSWSVEGEPISCRTLFSFCYSSLFRACVVIHAGLCKALNAKDPIWII